MKLMRFHTRLAAVFLALCAFGLAAAARADDCVSPFFQMADGRCYDATTHLSADSSGELFKLIDAQGSASSTPIADATATPALPPTPTIVLAVQRAHQLLQAAIDADANKKPKIVTSQNVWVDVTLAVWNAETDEIQLVQAKKNGMSLKLDPAAPDDFKITVAKNNGVNSTFAVDRGERIVVAVRYPIFKNVSVSRRKPRFALHDVVYTPYSDALRTSEMIAWGKDTAHGEIRAAFDALRAASVHSRAFPDQLMSDVIDPKLVESIAIIEHVGLGGLSDGYDTATDAFYVTLGGNQADAYLYARSPAGALGLVQFIPSTYALMAKRKDLGLIPNFDQGMADPVNAIKAQIGYLDAILADMPLSVKDLYHVDPTRVDEYLAAAYNTGDGRVRKTIAQWGDAWSEPHAADINALAKKKGRRSHAVKKLKAATLLPETVIYVKKLRQALNFLNPPALPLA